MVTRCSFMALVCLAVTACAEAPTDALPAAEQHAASAPTSFPGATEPAAICGRAAGRFTTRIDNPFFPLRVCERRVIEGEEDGVNVAVRMTVLDETRVVAGVRTRVLEELHTEDGELVELSYNFFAQARGGGVPPGGTVPRDGTVCYFGETVDIFEPDGTVTHEGAWRAGRRGARAGIIMPSVPRAGQAYLQEVAPGVAEDRAWHTALAGGVLEVTEDTPLEPGQLSFKRYRRGVGLIADGTAQLVSIEQLSDEECERFGRGGETEDDDD